MLKIPERFGARGRVIVVILLITFTQIASSHPLIREFSDNPSPRRGAIRFLPRGRCVWLLGALGLAGGAGTWGYFKYLHNDADPPAVIGRFDPRDLPALPEGPKPLFSGNDEVSLRFDALDGKPPTLTLFNRNGLQRTMASTFHQHMADQETDPRKKKRWENAPPGIQASFEGLKLRPSVGHPGQVEVTIVGNGEEAPVPQTISRRDLESGKPIRIALADKRYPIDQAGEADISGSMVLQYLPDRGVVVVRQADINLTATIFGMNTLDSGHFANLVARPWTGRNLASVP